MYGQCIQRVNEVTVHVRTIGELFVNNLCYMEVSCAV